jgi:AraC-like DNA-binding protein
MTVSGAGRDVKIQQATKCGSTVWPFELLPVRELARECRLSSAHFPRAFRRSAGMAPHDDWLIEQRIVLSKKKLRDDRRSLSDVAAECGFTDQSHFTRMFNRIVGVPPGAWRRALKE